MKAKTLAKTVTFGSTNLNPAHYCCPFIQISWNIHKNKGPCTSIMDILFYLYAILSIIEDKEKNLSDMQDIKS